MRRESSENTGAVDESFVAQHRLTFIVLCIVLMAAVVIIVGHSLRVSQHEAQLDAPPTGDTPSIPVEAGVFRYSSEALNYLKTPPTVNTRRTMTEFYQRRSYPGGPPVIPHEILNKKGFGGDGCLQCHQDGGWVEQFDAYTPVTPHPELVNCRQCHVAASDAPLFKSTEWQTVAPPEINQQAMPGSPPPTPHGLHLRENCLACHAGPGAVAELRTDHPERVNCRQCHVVNEGNRGWQRSSVAEK